MARFFTFSELIASETAQRKGLANIPNWEQIDNLRALADNVLDRARELWGRPLYVNSGFRCEALNAFVGGKPTSQHLRGQAADITTGSTEGNCQLFEMIAQSDIAFDQLIDESGYSWLHISYSPKPRRKLLHL